MGIKEITYFSCNLYMFVVKYHLSIAFEGGEPMANTKSAKKRIRVIEKRTAINRK